MRMGTDSSLSRAAESNLVETIQTNWNSQHRLRRSLRFKYLFLGDVIVGFAPTFETGRGSQQSTLVTEPGLLVIDASFRLLFSKGRKIQIDT